MAVLLPHVPFWFSSLLLRIENPYTQWVWIANPDQRHAAEHLLSRSQRHGMEHPLGREWASVLSEHPLGRNPF